MSSLPLALCTAVIALTLSGCASPHASTEHPPATAQTAAAKSPAQADLVIQVDAPFVFDLLSRDDVVDALYWQLEQALVGKNKDLKIEQLRSDEGRADQPRLVVTLHRWRTTHMGDIECRFTAEYHFKDTKQSLGMFEGRQSSVTRSRGFLGRDFERAAEDAGRQLRTALEKRGLL